MIDWDLIPGFLPFALAVCACAWFLSRQGKGRRDGDRITAKALLTGNEIEFLSRLRRALPDHHVFPQVAMAALMTSRLRRGRFDRKIVDFVVCDHRMTVLALVELDDRTHRKDADRARDALTRSAGYRTVRYSSKSKPDAGRIARDVLSA